MRTREELCPSMISMEGKDAPGNGHALGPAGVKLEHQIMLSICSDSAHKTAKTQAP